MARLSRAIASAALAAAAAWPAPRAAAAQVNTCAYPDGSLVYTDKACATVGARPATDTGRPRIAARYRNACARDFPALLIELSTAIEVGDVNQLAAFYQWTGLSTRAGYDIMARLETIAGRPLVDIVPLYATPEPVAGSLYYPPLDAEAHRPVGVRIEQTLDNGTTPASTTLRLAREAGCWWVRL